MHRNDLAPFLAGLILGQSLSELLLATLSPSGYLSLAGALIYMGWLTKDTIAVFRST